MTMYNVHWLCGDLLSKMASSTWSLISSSFVSLSISISDMPWALAISSISFRCLRATARGISLETGHSFSMTLNTFFLLLCCDVSSVNSIIKPKKTSHWVTRTRQTHWSSSCCCWPLTYSAILCSRVDLLRSHVTLDKWLAFHSTFLNIHQNCVLTVLFGCYMVGAR